MASISKILDLSGKTAIVTGGAAGIGLGISSRLAESGAAVVIADVSEENAKKSAEELKSKGYKVAAVRCDVSNKSDAEAMVSFSVSTFGGLDILVNNAGVYPSVLVMQMTDEDWDRGRNITLKGGY